MKGVFYNMKEKNLKRSAHFISVLLNVGCIIFGVLSMALFIGIIAIVCTQLFSPDMFQEAWKTATKNGQLLSFRQCVFFFYLLSWYAYLYLFSTI